MHSPTRVHPRQTMVRRGFLTAFVLVGAAACGDRVDSTGMGAAAPVAPSLSANALASTAPIGPRFEFVTGAYTWPQAKAAAEARGGRLAVVKSAETQALLVELASAGMPSGQYWIGGQHSGGSAVCGWRWLDGSDVAVPRPGACVTTGYSNWHMYNPSGDVGGISFLWQPGDATQRGTWNDANIGHGFGYIVEYPAVSGSASCAAVKAAHPEAGDAAYAITLAGGTVAALHCVDMASAPKSYLPLPNGGATNYASWNTVTTRYQRLRLDPVTLKVDVGDARFSATSGTNNMGWGGNIASVSYTVGAACDGSEREARVDLRGTPLGVRSLFTMLGWYPHGHIAGTPYSGSGGTPIYQTVVSQDFAVKGGGGCGGVSSLPDFHAGLNGGGGYALQLAVVGAGLPSPLATLNGPTTAMAGAAVAFTTNASHPAGVAIWSTYDLGDGTTGSGPLPGSHLYAAPGTYTVTYTVTDGATAPAVATHAIVVAQPNRAPVASAGGPYAGIQGSVIEFAGTATDADGDALTYAWDFDADGVIEATTAAASHTYPATGTFVATLTVRDGRGGESTSSATVTVAPRPNRPPTADAGGPYTGKEGVAITFAASGTDPDGDALSYAWDFDGDGTTDATTATATRTYGDDGTYTARLTVTDGRGGSTTATATATVANVAPTGVFVTPADPKEGSAILFSVTGVSDVAADRATLTYQFRCGTIQRPASASPSASCMVADDGLVQLAVTIADKDGGTTTYSKTVRVDNVVPDVTFRVDPVIVRGQTATIEGSFTDPGDDVWKLGMTWGDGSAPVVVQNAAKSFRYSRTYKSSGVFGVYVQVADDEGAIGESRAMITVLTPAAASRTFEDELDKLVVSSDLPPQEATVLKKTIARVTELTGVETPTTPLTRQQKTTAVNQLTVFDNQVGALENSKRITPTTATTLKTRSSVIRTAIETEP